MSQGKHDDVSRRNDSDDIHCLLSKEGFFAELDSKSHFGESLVEYVMCKVFTCKA